MQTVVAMDKLQLFDCEKKFDIQELPERNTQIN